MKDHSEDQAKKFNTISSKRHLDLKKLLYDHFVKEENTPVKKPKGKKKKNKK